MKYSLYIPLLISFLIPAMSTQTFTQDVMINITYSTHKIALPVHHSVFYCIHINMQISKDMVRRINFNPYHNNTKTSSSYYPNSECHYAKNDQQAEGEREIGRGRGREGGSKKERKEQEEEEGEEERERKEERRESRKG